MDVHYQLPLLELYIVLKTLPLCVDLTQRTINPGILINSTMGLTSSYILQSVGL